MGKQKDESLWDIGISRSEESASQNRVEEKTVLVIGGKSSGKTSLILRFLDRDEPAKPTTALEYTFGRKSRGHNNVKDVGHIWELGGGVSFTKLIDIPINSQNIQSLSVVLALDLSQPEFMFSTADALLAALTSCIEQALREAARRDESLWKTIQARMDERIGADHMDKELIEACKIPLLIVGTKFDLFQTLDPENRKIIAKTLRFISHIYGASLVFTSLKIESTISKFKAQFGSLLFGTAGVARQAQFDHSKPLLITAGSDSIQSIGSPPISEDDVGKVSARNPLELWRHAFGKHFPQTSLKPSQQDDQSKSVQFSEPIIDKMRMEKDEELERYRKLSERKMRELENQAAQEGIF